MRLRWLLVALGFSLLMAVVHFYALANHLYWSYRWLDTPMHLLGGAMMGAATIGVLLRFRPYSYVAAIALGAIGWEVFEYAFGISTGLTRYAWDTWHDLLNDAIGASAIYLFARFTIWHSK